MSPLEHLEFIAAMIAISYMIGALTRGRSVSRSAAKPGVRMVEGVPWFRHQIRFRMADGRRVRWIRWSPGAPWIREELTRELVDRGITPEQLKPNSCVITVDP